MAGWNFTAFKPNTDERQSMTKETDTISEGDEMARQTAQAKMLREARDELAKRAEALAGKKDKRGLERMGLPPDSIARLLDGGQFNTGDLAHMLGRSLKTVQSWLQPPTTGKGRGAKFYRTMPENAKLLLARIRADK